MIPHFDFTKVLADLFQVPSMGSSAIGIIVGLYSSVTKEPGGSFVIVGTTPRVPGVFDLPRLIDLIPSPSDVRTDMALPHLVATTIGTIVSAHSRPVHMV